MQDTAKTTDAMDLECATEGATAPRFTVENFSPEAEDAYEEILDWLIERRLCEKYPEYFSSGILDK